MARRMFFVDEVRGGRAEIAGEDARHLRKVLRAEVGQKYELSDNQQLYLAEIDSLGKDVVSFRVIEPLASQRSGPRLTILASLIKFDRLEWIIEKATELGVEAIVPVEAERSEHGLERAAVKRVERWRRIALESSQQSRRVTMPTISAPVDFEDALNFPADHRFFLDEEQGGKAILGAIPAGHNVEDSLAVLIGPEGGWVEYERNAAGAAGWSSISLGPRILRAETAAIAALAILSAAWRP